MYWIQSLKWFFFERCCLYARQRILSQSKETLNCFKSQNLNLLEWPPKSPDQNPIENVWNYLDTRVRKRQVEIKSLDDLWRILEEKSLKIDLEFIKKLYKSLPKKIIVLKENNFDSTKY